VKSPAVQTDHPEVRSMTVDENIERVREAAERLKAG